MSFWKDLQNAIKETLKREIPEIQTCETVKNLIAPAVLVELSSFEPGSDPATGELSLRARFEARVIVDSVIPNAGIEIRGLVAEIARVVHQNSWGMEVSPGEFLGASLDVFKPELDAYIVWVVEWVHELHQGESVWKPSEIQPHKIYIQ